MNMLGKQFLVAWNKFLNGPQLRMMTVEKITKLELDWIIIEDQITGYNLRALNAILSRVGASQFKLISTCTTAKEVWEILQVAYEGTRTV